MYAFWPVLSMVISSNAEWDNSCLCSYYKLNGINDGSFSTLSVETHCMLLIIAWVSRWKFITTSQIVSTITSHNEPCLQDFHWNKNYISNNYYEVCSTGTISYTPFLFGNCSLYWMYNLLNAEWDFFIAFAIKHGISWLWG